MAAVTHLETVRPPVIDEPTLLAPNEIATIPGTARFGRAQAEFEVKVPDVVDDPYAALIVDGFGGIGAGYEDVANAIARRRKLAIVMDPAYSYSILHNLDPRYIISPEKLHSQANYSVMKKVMGMDGLDIKGFDIVGHSMGGFTGSETAKHKPESVRSMTFLASAGQYEQSMTSLALGGIRFITKEIPGIAANLRPNHAGLAIKQLVRYWSSPHRRLLEGLATGHCNVAETARHLVDLGVITSIVLFENDSFFDHKKAIANMSKVVDIIEPHDDARAGHGAPQIAPEEVAKSLFRVWHKVAIHKSTVL